MDAYVKHIRLEIKKLDGRDRSQLKKLLGYEDAIPSNSF